MGSSPETERTFLSGASVRPVEVLFVESSKAAAAGDAFTNRYQFHFASTGGVRSFIN